MNENLLDNLYEARIFTAIRKPLIEKAVRALEDNPEEMLATLNTLDNINSPELERLCLNLAFEYEVHNDNKSVSISDSIAINGDTARKYLFYGCISSINSIYEKIYENNLLGPKWIMDVFGSVYINKKTIKMDTFAVFIRAAYILFTKGTVEFKKTYPYLGTSNIRAQYPMVTTAYYKNREQPDKSCITLLRMTFTTALNNIFSVSGKAGTVTDAESGVSTLKNAGNMRGALRFKYNSLNNLGRKGDVKDRTKLEKDMDKYQSRMSISDDDLFNAIDIIERTYSTLKNCIINSKALWVDNLDEESVKEMFPDFEIGDNSLSIVDPTNKVIALDKAIGAKILYTVLEYAEEPFLSICSRASCISSKVVGGRAKIRTATIDAILSKFAKETNNVFDAEKFDLQASDALGLIAKYYLCSDNEKIVNARKKLSNLIASIFKSKFGYELKIDDSLNPSRRSSSAKSWGVVNVGSTKESLRALSESLNNIPFDDIYAISFKE